MPYFFVIIFLISGFLFFLSLINPSTGLFWKKTKQTRINAFWIYGAVCMISIVLVGITASDSLKKAATAESATTSKENKPTEVTEKKVYTNDYLKEQLSKPAIGFEFKEGMEVEGKTNDVGTLDQNIVQILSKDGVVSDLSVTVIPSKSTSANTNSIAIILGIANIFDTKATKWIEDKYANIKEKKALADSVVIGTNKYKFYYTPSEFFASTGITIQPNYSNNQ